MLFFALMTFILLETGEATVQREVFEDPRICQLNAMKQSFIVGGRDDVAYSHITCVMEHHL